jgi:hypothetical protein
VGSAIEVLHSLGGGAFSLGVVDQYLEAPLNPRNDITGVADCHAADVWNVAGCGRGNGTINTLLAQYEFSVRDMLDAIANGGGFFGGSDLKLKGYGMLNLVKSDTTLEPRYSDYSKLKYGADLQFDIASGVSLGFRADRVQPHSEIPEQSFSILSPRLMLRTSFASHETIALQYSRYSYAARECLGADPLQCVQPAPSGTAPDGFGSTPGINQGAPVTSAGTQRPDLNTVKLEVSMWW